MQISKEHLLEELRQLIRDLGKDGGIISPSIYDTALGLIYSPPREGVEPAIEWILSQQNADGGWGEPIVPSSRDVPTLAALLALVAVEHSLDVSSCINRAQEFLTCQAECEWAEIELDTFPVAVEYTIPYLLDLLEEAGIQIDRTRFARLFEVRQQKEALLRNYRFIRGTAPLYSWETHGSGFSVDLQDGSGGIGHSPAATSRWLKMAREKGVDSSAIEDAQAYLSMAAKATQHNIPGLLPVVWPIDGFEQSYGLYTLMFNSLLSHSAFDDEVSIQLERLHRSIDRRHGIGMSNDFSIDLDCTAAAVAALAHLRYPMPKSTITQFQHKDHFYTYRNELNPSVLSNAHAILALYQCGIRVPHTEEFLMCKQYDNAIWRPDKWHSSWRHITAETVIALTSVQNDGRLERTAARILLDQNDDGGWGDVHVSSATETAFSLTALNALLGTGCACIQKDVYAAIERGVYFLRCAQLDGHGICETKRWIGKELYSVPRVNQLYVMSCLVSLFEHDRAYA